jgi:hypothetical protein
MPVASEEDKDRLLLPDHEILRVAKCLRGEVEIQMRFAPRPHYGRRRGRIRDAGRFGVRVEVDADLLVLRSDFSLDITADGEICGHARLRAGEAVHASLTLADDSSAVLPPLGEWSRAAIARSVAWWRDWASRLRYDGPRREMVIRSAPRAQALGLRAVGSGGGRTHDLFTRARWRRPQLGLSLLLAAARRLHRPGAVGAGLRA